MRASTGKGEGDQRGKGGQREIDEGPEEPGLVEEKTGEKAGDDEEPLEKERGRRWEFGERISQQDGADYMLVGTEISAKRREWTEHHKCAL